MKGVMANRDVQQAVGVSGSAAHFSLAEDRYARIGDFFKRRRMESGLSLVEVSQDLNIDQVLLNAYEAGAQPIPLDTVFTLTNLLNVPPEDVMILIYDVHSHGND